MAEHNLQTVAFLTHAVKLPKPGNVFQEGAITNSSHPDQEPGLMHS